MKWVKLHFCEGLVPVGLALVVALAALLAVFWAGGTTPAYAVPFTVTNTADSGVGSLRAAIEEANALGGTDTINFTGMAGVPTISPTSALPTITEAVTIDGTTAGGGMVELNGTGAGFGANGLNITAGGTTVKGLVINRFSGNGIRLTTNGGNTIEGNFIGTNVSGNAPLGNGVHGVRILGVPSNIIARNVISGNGFDGVRISALGATGNLVRGNLIGTNAAGTAPLGNSGLAGVVIEGAPGNIIGGTTGTTPGGPCTGACNVISGNAGSGVHIVFSGSFDNVVEGNFIGTDVTGSADLGNTRHGVVIDKAPNNIIGGTGAGNVISGNDASGVLIIFSGFFSGSSTLNVVQGNFIGTKANGMDALPNSNDGVVIVIGASNNTIGGTVSGEGNTIAFNVGDGVRVDGAGTTGNTIRGNSIHSNGGLGIENSNGGNTELAPPVITAAGSASGHTDPKCFPCTVEIFSDDAGEGRIFHGFVETINDATGSWSFPGDVIGPTVTATATDASGNTSEFSSPFVATFAVNSTADPGVGVCDATECTLREAINAANAGTPDTITFDIPASDPGCTAGVCTITPGSALPTITGPVIINGYTQSGASANTNPPGLGSNAVLKIELDGTSAGAFATGLNITAGGSTVKGLAINRFGRHGIRLTTNGVNTIEGNFIGTDVTGTLDRGNGRHGVRILGAPSNTIGGITAEARNVISGNGFDGVRISALGATGNDVQGNFIGTDKNGTAPLGNSGLAGVVVEGAPSNTIGGTTDTTPGGPCTGACNVISGNDGSGVHIVFSGAHDNVVEGNYIGTDVSGSADLGNTSNGVVIDKAPNNIIGGITPEARNVISGNDASGVLIIFSGFLTGSSTENQVKGNFIGTKADGTSPRGNTSFGVAIVIGASDNTIGGTVSGEGNTIAFNGGDGVLVDGAATTGNKIRGNSIHSNGGLGIENSNGGNTELTPPVVTSAGSANGTSSCLGCTVEVFSDAADEGKVFHGSRPTNATTGAWSFDGAVTGPNVTATVTDGSGNTSEFSTPIVTPGQVIQNVIDELQAIVDEECDPVAGCTPLGDKVQDAVDKAQDALDKLTAADNLGAMGAIEGAMGDLEAAAGISGLTPQQVSGLKDLMDDLAGAARQLAENAIADAEQHCSGHVDIADAETALDAGDEDRALGPTDFTKFKDAINDYKDAKALAEGVLTINIPPPCP